jgi:hypothetical protein
LEQLSEELDGKLDRLEFEPFKNKIQRQLEDLLKKLNSMHHLELDMDDDAAILRKCVWKTPRFIHINASVINSSLSVYFKYPQQCT